MLQRKVLVTIVICFLRHTKHQTALTDFSTSGVYIVAGVLKGRELVESNIQKMAKVSRLYF